MIGLEEETQAALTAAALNWPDGYGWGGEGSAGRYYMWTWGHIDRNQPGIQVLCGAASSTRARETLCPKCALLWYREVRDG